MAKTILDYDNTCMVSIISPDMHCQVADQHGTFSASSVYFHVFSSWLLLSVDHNGQVHRSVMLQT